MRSIRSLVVVVAVVVAVVVVAVVIVVVVVECQQLEVCLVSGCFLSNFSNNHTLAFGFVGFHLSCLF